MKVGDRVQLVGDSKVLQAKNSRDRCQGTIERIHNEVIHVAMDDGGRSAVPPSDISSVDACPE